MIHSAPSLSASVIICTYTLDRWQQLLDAVLSVERQERPPSEIVVVVDHNDELFNRARRHWGRHTIIRNTGPRGLSGARNSGVAAATGDVLAFLDDDARAEPGWLMHLLEPYQLQSVLGVGGRILPDWSEPQPTWFPEEFGWVIGCSYRGLPETLKPVRNLIGANMSFRRPVFQEVGGFRHTLGREANRPLGCEETELCIRAGQAWPQGEILYEPKAVVQHRVTPERGSWGYFMARCYGEGVSKARVAALTGSRRGLQSERMYVIRTLPSGLIRYLLDSRHGEWRSGLLRSMAIVLGLVSTAAGFLDARVRGSFQLKSAPPPRIAADVPELFEASLTGNSEAGPESGVSSGGPIPVSVVVCTRNRGHVLGRCLDAIQRANPAELLVIDGCSTDDTAEVAKLRAARLVSDGGRGLGSARQLGAELSNQPYVVLVDSDTIVTSATLENLVAEAESKSYDILQAQLLPPGRPADYWTKCETWRKSVQERPGSAAMVGCQATLVRRELLTKVGFDPAFVGAAEDADLCFRAAAEGFRVGFAESAIAYHHDRQGLVEFARQRVWHGRGMMRLLARYRGNYGRLVSRQVSNASSAANMGPAYWPFLAVSWVFLGLGLVSEGIYLLFHPGELVRLQLSHRASAPCWLHQAPVELH